MQGYPLNVQSICQLYMILTRKLFITKVYWYMIQRHLKPAAQLLGKLSNCLS